MLKDILNLKGVQKVTKIEQKAIKGGTEKPKDTCAPVGGVEYCWADNSMGRCVPCKGQ